MRLTREQRNELTARALLVLVGGAVLMVLSLGGCDKRRCVRELCQREAVIVVVTGGVGVPIYDDVCHCAEYADGGTSR